MRSSITDDIDHNDNYDEGEQEEGLDADDESEDEEFLRRQIMDFDVNKYEAQLTSTNKSYSIGLLSFTSAILLLSIVLIFQIYEEVLELDRKASYDML